MPESKLSFRRRRRSKVKGGCVFVLLSSLSFVFVFFPASCRAPFPPCSPLIFLNKMVEANNWSSDLNPYYPVRPCPYRNPARAPLRLRFAIANPPQNNFYHLTTEGTWLFRTGIPRALRMLFGRERFVWDPRILDEGYQRHHTGAERTRHFGRKTRKTKAYY